MRGKALFVAVVGAVTYGVTGAVWGGKNTGTFGLVRDNAGLQLWLGVGAALVIAGFAMAGWGARLREAVPLGPVAAVALVAGAALNVVGEIVDFAILGTLGLGLGLVLLAVAAVRHRFVAPADRCLLVASAVLSLTWNTETASAWLLAVNGLVWMVLSVRLLRPSATPMAWGSV